MVQYRAETKSLVRSFGDFLYQVGEESLLVSRTKDALRYLEASVAEARQLAAPNSILFRRIFRCMKVRAKTLSPSQATAEARGFLTTAPIEFTLDGQVWLAECLISQGSPLEGIEVLEQTLETNPRPNPATIDSHKTLVMAKMVASSALGELGDPVSVARARNLLDETIDLVQNAPQGHITKIFLGPIALRRRFELAENSEDRYDVCWRLIEFEAKEICTFPRILGGYPQNWYEFLEELKEKKMWAELEAFAVTYTQTRFSLLDIMKWRSQPVKDQDPTVYSPASGFAIRLGTGYEDPRSYITETVQGWADMHGLLGEAYVELGNMEDAEQNFWTAFILYLYGAPELTSSPGFKEILYHLAACLYQQGAKQKDKLDTLRSSYGTSLADYEAIFGPISQRFKSRKRDFQTFSEG
jgi:tetratricopeptide (TPR) repeat protein